MRESGLCWRWLAQMRTVYWRQLRRAENRLMSLAGCQKKPVSKSKGNRMERSMDNKPKIAVFASGNGSNFQAIADAVQSGQLEAELALVVTDRPSAFVVERAK